MKHSQILDLVLQFIVRRVYRHGSLIRKDIEQAFAVSTPSASRFIAEALATYPQHLRRQGHRVLAKSLSEAPSFANEADLLETLNQGCQHHEDLLALTKYTGLFPHELPLVYVSWTNSLPTKPGILTTIIRAIPRYDFLKIVSVTLNQGEERRERIILPVGLEKMNDQWRLIAQDMEKPGYPIRVFVLSRILHAEVIVKYKKPKDFVPYPESDKKIRIYARLNPAYTEDQQAILRHELNIKDGFVTIVSRSEFEFRRRFSEMPPSEKAVWPPLFLESPKKE
jgi:predicted DNA-binding transcriptional regulator YafY